LLFLKALAFGAMLFIVSKANFNFVGILFFCAIAFVLYFRPSFVGSYYAKYAFAILIGVSIFGMKIITDFTIFLSPSLADIAFGGGIFLFSFIFYLILGVKEVFFIKRSRIHYVVALLLFYTLFIIFFLSDKPNFYFLNYSAVIISSFLLFKEWLSIVSVFHFPKREFIASIAATFIVAQLLWAVALLPIGFIAAANSMLLFVLILGNFLFAHFTGGLSKIFLIRHLVLFLFLILLILRFFV